MVVCLYSTKWYQTNKEVTVRFDAWWRVLEDLWLLPGKNNNIAFFFLNGIMTGIFTSKHNVYISIKSFQQRNREGNYTAGHVEDSLKILKVTWDFLVHKQKWMKCSHKEGSQRSKLALFYRHCNFSVVKPGKVICLLSWKATICLLRNANFSSSHRVHYMKVISLILKAW